MSVVRISLLGIAASVIIILLKEMKNDYSPLISVAFGAITVLTLVSPIRNVIDATVGITGMTGIDNEVTRSVLGVCGISLIAECSAEICRDFGQTSIGDRIVSAGRIIILSMSVPLITRLIEECTRLIG